MAPFRPSSILPPVLAAAVAFAASADAALGQRLGPADGRDLAPLDLERVQAGDTAPDFALESHDGDVVTLSDFRGEQNVVLVFYRGHW